jgi:hypothetical protein
MRRSIGQWADDYLAAHPEQIKPKLPSTGMAKAIGVSAALGAITTVPLVGLVAAPFLMFKPLIRMATNTAAKQNAAIAAQAEIAVTAPARVAAFTQTALAPVAPPDYHFVPGIGLIRKPKTQDQAPHLIDHDAVIAEQVSVPSTDTREAALATRFAALTETKKFPSMKTLAVLVIVSAILLDGLYGALTPSQKTAEQIVLAAHNAEIAKHNAEVAAHNAPILAQNAAVKAAQEQRDKEQKEYENRNPPAGRGSDDGFDIIARYGRPDVDDTTAYDSPRPPIPTRFMDYREAGVRVGFIPRGRLGDPPPHTWTIIGFVDIAKQEKISIEEANRRLTKVRR